MQRYVYFSGIYSQYHKVSIQLFHTLVGNSQIFLPEVLWTTRCAIARGRRAEGGSASGCPQYRCFPQRHEIVVLISNKRKTICKVRSIARRPDALSLKAARPRTIMHRQQHRGAIDLTFAQRGHEIVVLLSNQCKTMRKLQFHLTLHGAWTGDSQKY